MERRQCPSVKGKVLLSLVVGLLFVCIWITSPVVSSLLSPRPLLDTRDIHFSTATWDLLGRVNVSKADRGSFPRILHHMYLKLSPESGSIPEKWKSLTQQCLDQNKDYNHIMWDLPMVEELLETHFPWFLDTFRSYRHPIQRADASRYFILFMYGGVYLDMDTLCHRSVDDFLSNATSVSTSQPGNQGDGHAQPGIDPQTQCVFAAEVPFGINQGVFACKPQADFLRFLISHLETFNRNYLLPYYTVMLASGPLFVTSCYYLYGNSSQVKIVPRSECNRYLRIQVSSSWHSWDGPVIMTAARHKQLTLVLFMVLFLALVCWQGGHFLKRNSCHISNVCWMF